MSIVRGCQKKITHSASSAGRVHIDFIFDKWDNLQDDWCGYVDTG